MKIAYNPSGTTLDNLKINKNDIIFDLNGLSIYAKGIQFKGTDTTYSVFKKHTSIKGGGHDGLVPVPSFTTTDTTTNLRFLCENGTWLIPEGNHKVSQSETNADTFRPLVLGAKYNSEPSNLGDPPVIDQVYTTTKVYVQPKKGNIYATTFVGNLKGTADKANSVDWANITNKPSLSLTDHTHSFLTLDSTISNDPKSIFQLLESKTNNSLGISGTDDISSLISYRGINALTTHYLAFSDNGQLYRKVSDGNWMELVDSNNFKLFTAGNSEKLENHKLQDFLLKSEVLTYHLTVLEKDLKVTTSWQDTGIILDNINFPEGTGSYLIQISMGDGYIWTGYCTLNINALIETKYNDEIMLHGGGLENAQPYLRTINDLKHNNAKIQIAYSKNRDKQEKWTFKFKRII